MNDKLPFPICSLARKINSLINYHYLRSFKKIEKLIGMTGMTSSLKKTNNS